MVAGDLVALARVGAVLPGGFAIKRAKIRGVESFGMMCSEKELGLAEESSGILILPEGTPLGAELTEVLGLPDTVVEVEITPNRPDWLCVAGVAREVAALTGRALKLPEPVIAESAERAADAASVTIEAPDLCHRYAARLIRGVKIGPSPLWMQARLESAGVRPISNVVDVTNYVLMELGHPLHAFDFNKLAAGGSWSSAPRRARSSPRSTTPSARSTADNLMICDGGGAVAVAGIMGGLNSEVDDATEDVLLESAWFLPSNIRRTAKTLGLKTEASYRFERGADIEGLIRALERAAQLIVELAGGAVSRGILDAYPTRHEPKRIELRLARASSILGVAVEAEEAARLLGALGIAVTSRSADALRVEAPTFRVDIEREIDLIEEIARLRGYDTIPVTLPRSSGEPTTPSAETLFPDKLRDALAEAGLREAITLSFVDPCDDERIGLAPASPLLRQGAAPEPPGAGDLGAAHLAPSGAPARRGPQRPARAARRARSSRWGRPSTPWQGNPPREEMRAAGLIAGRRHPLGWWSTTDKADFFDAKGVVESALWRVGAEELRFEAAADIPWLQPGRAARILCGGQEAGWIGEVLPDLLDAYDLAAPVAVFQFDVGILGRPRKIAGNFRGLARFPAMERDIALLVDRAVTSEAVADVVRALDLPLVRGVLLFDAFEGGKLPEGKQSLAFRITYRDDERTLTEEEVSPVEKKIVAALTERFGARLRDA